MNAEFLIANFGGWGFVAIIFWRVLVWQGKTYRELLTDLRNHLQEDIKQQAEVNKALGAILEGLRAHNQQAAERHQLEMQQLGNIRR